METDNHGRVGRVTIGVGIKDDGRREERIGGARRSGVNTQRMLADSA